MRKRRMEKFEEAGSLSFGNKMVLIDEVTGMCIG